jgi:hypothetical protein
MRMIDTNKTLTFANGNAKLTAGDTVLFSLPAGHTCPSASLCRSSADKETGKIKDGPHTQFRCFATTPEMLFPNVRASRWQNFELLKQAKTAIGMANLIESALLVKKNLKLIRFNASGDFFTQAYFDAWLMVAQEHPEWTVYGYTKMLHYWIKRLNLVPSNMKIVASRGGTHDNLIGLFGLRTATVVFSENEAKEKGLEIDHDDSLLWKGDKDFALLLHGNQPANSEAGKAWYQIHKHGKGGYKSAYFKHYEKSGKSKRKTVDGKHIHVPVVTIKPVTVKNKAGKIKINFPKVHA